jgi:hypothetical protein
MTMRYHSQNSQAQWNSGLHHRHSPTQNQWLLAAGARDKEHECRLYNCTVQASGGGRRNYERPVTGDIARRGKMAARTSPHRTSPEAAGRDIKSAQTA